VKYRNESKEANALLDVARAAFRLKGFFPDFAPGDVIQHLHQAADYSSTLLDIIMQYERRDRVRHAGFKRLRRRSRNRSRLKALVVRRVFRARALHGPALQRDVEARTGPVPTVQVVSKVTTAHGDSFAKALVPASESNFELRAIVASVGVMVWPDDPVAQSLHNGLTGTILRLTFSRAKPAIAAAFVEAVRDVFAAERALSRVPSLRRMDSKRPTAETTRRRR
jgi:hypothetical protein